MTGSRLESMEHAKLRNRHNVLFCALDAYSSIGGIETFNRHVINALSTRSSDCVHVRLLKDFQKDLTTRSRAKIVGFSRRRLPFIGCCLKRSFRSSVIILGHINLVILAPLFKLFNRSTKLLLFVHGQEVWNKPEFRNKRWFDEVALRFVDQVISVSSYTATEMSREYRVPLHKFQILPNCVDNATGVSLDPVQARSRRSEARQMTVLTVARLTVSERQKNLHRSIEAFSRVANIGPEAVYCVVGEGELTTELGALAVRLRIAERVQFLGRVTAEGLERLYKDAQVFILLSTKEGFGIVFLEAWLRGVPVICAHKGAPSEIIEDGHDGYVVDPSDPEGVASRLLFLLKNPQVARKM